MDFPIIPVGSAAATAAILLTIAWPIVRPWVEKLVDRRFDYEFASRLETHKRDLELTTEAAKYDFQKKLTNVSLHTARRHDAYAKAFRAARLAHGLMVNQRGLRKSPTFEEYNEADVEAYLRLREAPQGFIDEIKHLWSRDRKSAKEKLVPYAKMLEFQGAERGFDKAKNQLYLNELYLSAALEGMHTAMRAELASD
ncbi:MAG: hypothetical protein ACT443_15355 [Gemmatimonadota bacterium]